MGREAIIQAVAEEAAGLASVALRLGLDRCLGGSHCRPMTKSRDFNFASRHRVQYL
jgi:hypothetical protein